jgi:hypothetical protein
MKKVLLVLVVILGFVSCSSDDTFQDIDEDDENCAFKVSTERIIHSQEAIDNFGSYNYTKVVGDLRINTNIDSSTGLSPITNLDALSCLTHITGTLSIIYNDELTSIEGLQNLDTVEGSIYISINQSLENLNGLENITDINGDLGIGGASINNISSLNNLTSIGGDLLIDSTEALINLDGLESLTSVGGDIGIGYAPVTDGGLNTALLNLNGLGSLISVGGNFLLTHNTALTNFCGIENIITNLTNNGIEFNYLVENNLYNPTIQDIIDGNCSL